MSDKLHAINVTLSENQKMQLSEAFFKRGPITLRLKNDALSGNDTLVVPSTIFERLEKNRAMNKGMEIKLLETNFIMPISDSLLSSILSLSRTHGPSLAKTLGMIV